MLTFSPAARLVLDRYMVRLIDEAAMTEGLSGSAMSARRDELLLSIGEEVGDVLASLAVAFGARTIVEIGTSYGFSTLFLAAAAEQTGGTVHTIEIAAEKQAHARAEIEAAGLAHRVTWHLGDALAVLDALPGPFDFVLIDLWKDLYLPCLERVHPKLAKNGVIAADNIIHPTIYRAESNAYRAAVRRLPDLETMLLPIGSGIELSCKLSR